MVPPTNPFRLRHQCTQSCSMSSAKLQKSFTRSYLSKTFLALEILERVWEYASGLSLSLRIKRVRIYQSVPVVRRNFITSQRTPDQGKAPKLWHVWQGMRGFRKQPSIIVPPGRESTVRVVPVQKTLRRGAGCSAPETVIRMQYMYWQFLQQHQSEKMTLQTQCTFSLSRGQLCNWDIT